MDQLILSDTRTRPPTRLFWLGWVAASTAAILLGFVILYVLVGLAKAVLLGVNEDRLFGFLMFPVLATVLGAGQWLVLRTRIPRSGWWVLATGVGMLIGVALASGIVQVSSRVTEQSWDWGFQPGILVLYLLIGVSLGLAQLPVLWRHITRPGLWLLTSMVGWLALGLIMGKSIDRTSDILALGAVPAAFTGLGLIWLLRTTRSQSTRSA
jgi:hypothetical protein